MVLLLQEAHDDLSKCDDGAGLLVDRVIEPHYMSAA